MSTLPPGSVHGPVDTTATGMSPALEIDDIQSGALSRATFARTSARTCCSRSTSLPTAGSSSGGCIPLLQPGRAHRTRARGLVDRRLHLRGSQGARCPAGLAGQLRTRSSSRAWLHVLPSSGTSAPAARSTGRSRSAARTCTSPWPPSPPTRHSLDAVVDRARRAQEQIPGVEVIWRQDCYQLPTGRTSFGFKDGIGQPTVEGAGTPPTNRGELPIKAGEFILGYPDETGGLAPVPTPDVLGRNGTYIVFRKLHTRVAAYRQYLHDKARTREEEALLGAKMVGSVAERRAARAGSGRGRPGPRRRPRPQQRLRVRRRPARLHVPSRVPCAPGEPAGLARPRDERRRPAAPHDPPGHELRSDAAGRRPRGRRGRPGHHLRLRRGTPQAPVRVREDPVAQRRDLHRRARREGPARRGHATGPAPSPSRSTPSAAGCPTCRPSWSPAAASTASPPGSARCGGWRTSPPDGQHPTRGERMSDTTGTDRWKALDFAPPPPDEDGVGAVRAARVPVRRQRRRDHPEPAARRQRHHDGDGCAPDRGSRDDRRSTRRPRRAHHRGG